MRFRRALIETPCHRFSIRPRSQNAKTSLSKDHKNEKTARHRCFLTKKTFLTMYQERITHLVAEGGLSPGQIIRSMPSRL